MIMSCGDQVHCRDYWYSQHRIETMAICDDVYLIVGETSLPFQGCSETSHYPKTEEKNPTN